MGADMGKGVLHYEIRKGKAYITGYEGARTELELPGQIEGCPVRGIARKAFLGQKGIYSICVPEGTEEVGDWAFAQCSGLVRICFPGKNIRFGKSVFQGCRALRQIVVGDRKQEECPAGGDVSQLLAAAVTMMDAPWLLDLPGAGGAEWLAKWDARLRTLLETRDREGYFHQAVCGEEDFCGMEPEAYASGKRKEKVRLALLRLLHPQGLEPFLQKELEEYLRSLTRGGRAGEETWQVVWQEYGGERAYYALFAGLGCITRDNFDGILADMGENYPEMKAYFLNAGEACTGEDDFFRELELP